MEPTKILCGSSELFKTIPGFTPGDTDYLLITDSEKVFEHQHPEPDVCWFIWGGDKAGVRKYVLDFPYYLTAMSLVTEEFVKHYEFSRKELVQAIDKYYSIYENSTYRYYIPLFDFIKKHNSWEFSQETIDKTYALYKQFKKR